jgi:hypothetical protein
MTGLQIERAAAQEVLRVAVRREGDRMTWKNDEDVWRRSETGVQLRNVELERNLVKKEGHEAAVKLLPNELSKGNGSGVVMTVTDGAVPDVVEVEVALWLSFEEDDGDIVVEAEEWVDEAVVLIEDVEEGDLVVEDSAVPCSKRSCLLCSQFKGAGLVSM